MPVVNILKRNISFVLTSVAVPACVGVTINGLVISMLVPECITGEIQGIKDSFLVLNMSDVNVVKLNIFRSREWLHAGDKETSVIIARGTTRGEILR